MNGVARGGSVSAQVQVARGAYRGMYWARTFIAGTVGFRCEWCNKGWLLWWRMGISCK